MRQQEKKDTISPESAKSYNLDHDARLRRLEREISERKMSDTARDAQDETSRAGDKRPMSFPGPPQMQSDNYDRPGQRHTMSMAEKASDAAKRSEKAAEEALRLAEEAAAMARGARTMARKAAMEAQQNAMLEPRRTHDMRLSAMVLPNRSLVTGNEPRESTSSDEHSAGGFQTASIPEGQNEPKRYQFLGQPAPIEMLRGGANICQNCGLIGYHNFNCPKHETLCRGCGDAGHLVRDCPDRLRVANQAAFPINTAPRPLHLDSPVPDIQRGANQAALPINIAPHAAVIQSQFVGGNALQDYNRQLRLLEQQNKERLMRARQEQDAMAMPLVASSAYAANQESRYHTQLGCLEQQNKERVTGIFPAPCIEIHKMSDYQMEPDEKREEKDTTWKL